MATVFKDDLTIIYLTANQQPTHWTRYQRSILFKAAQEFPIITVSREELEWGNVNLLDTEPRSHLNMYKQMLKAAKLAKTPYIAAAEDDVLYSREHFEEFRPPLDTFAYDWRWSLFTWVRPATFNIKQRISNCTSILPRELFIEAWEERLAKFPGDSMPPHRVSEVGRNNQEEWMGVTKRKCIEFQSSVPCIHVNHPNGTDSTGYNKRMGRIRAYTIPYWGNAASIIKEYH